MTVPLPKNLIGTSCFRVLTSALQRYQASRAVHASARKYNQLFSRIYSLFKPPCELLCKEIERGPVRTRRKIAILA